MAIDDPTMEDDLRETLAADEIVLEEDWADSRHRFGVLCATAGGGLEQRPRTGDATADVKKNSATQTPICHARVGLHYHSLGITAHFLVCGGVPHEWH